MATFQRSNLCHEAPEQYDALLPCERQVLALWDAGASVEKIGVLCGMSLSRVKWIARKFDDSISDDLSVNEEIRAGSEALRDRILQFHPHVAFGRES